MKKFLKTFEAAGIPEMVNPIRIVLADDDTDDCDLFSSALEDSAIPASLHTVHDGEALINWLQNTDHLPDLIFLDLNMPLKNGFESLKEIKNDVRLMSLPVICLSTTLDQVTIQRVYQSGAMHYIQKPNKYQDLIVVICRAINLCRQTKPHGPVERVGK